MCYIHIYIYIFRHIIWKTDCGDICTCTYIYIHIYTSTYVNTCVDIHACDTRTWKCTLQCVAVCCSVLQCVAVCCSVLQCVAVCCIYMHVIHAYASTFWKQAGVCSSENRVWAHSHTEQKFRGLNVGFRVQVLGFKCRV